MCRVRELAEECEHHERKKSHPPHQTVGQSGIGERWSTVSGGKEDVVERWSGIRNVGLDEIVDPQHEQPKDRPKASREIERINCVTDGLVHGRSHFLVGVGSGTSIEMLLDGSSVRLRCFCVVLGVVFCLRFFVSFGIKDTQTPFLLRIMGRPLNLPLVEMIRCFFSWLFDFEPPLVEALAKRLSRFFLIFAESWSPLGQSLRGKPQSAPQSSQTQPGRL